MGPGDLAGYPSLDGDATTLCADDEDASSLTKEELIARYAVYGMDRDYALFVRALQRGELSPLLVELLCNLVEDLPVVKNMGR